MSQKWNLVTYRDSRVKSFLVVTFGIFQHRFLYLDNIKKGERNQSSMGLGTSSHSGFSFFGCFFLDSLPNAIEGSCCEG